MKLLFFSHAGGGEPDVPQIDTPTLEAIYPGERHKVDVARTAA